MHERENQSHDTTPRSFETLVETGIVQAFRFGTVPDFGTVHFPVEVQGYWKTFHNLLPSRVSRTFCASRPHDAQEICPSVYFKGYERMGDSKNSARVQRSGHYGHCECAFLSAIDEFDYHMSENLRVSKKRERGSTLDRPLSDLPLEALRRGVPSPVLLPKRVQNYEEYLTWRKKKSACQIGRLTFNRLNQTS